MIVVELSFTDDPARLALRPAHRQLLAELHAEGVLVQAGPFADESGSLLVFDAPRERVDQALAADPYYAARGVMVASVREWTLVVG